MRSLAVFVDAVCGHHLLPWIYLHRLMPLNICDSLNSDREGSLSWSLLSAVFLSVDTRWYKNWDHTSPHPYLYEQQLVVFLGPSWFQWPQGHQGLHDPRCDLCTFFFLRCSNDEFMIWWAYNASFAVGCACCRRWFHTWEWHWLETRSLYCWSDYLRGLSRSLECAGGCNKIIELSKSSWFVVYAVALPALIFTAMTSLFAEVASPSMVQSFQMRISSWNTPVLESCPWPTLDPTRSFSASVYGRLWLRVRVAADD